MRQIFMGAAVVLLVLLVGSTIALWVYGFSKMDADLRTACMANGGNLIDAGWGRWHCIKGAKP